VAWATTKQQVLDRINKLTLQTNEHGQYTHDAILLLQKDIRRILAGQFKPSNLGKGMEKLPNNSNNLLMLIESTNEIMVCSVIKAAKLQADELSYTTSKTLLPTITAQTEAQEEADQLNVINQVVISAKEGIVEAITKMVGSNITNAILQMADESDYKSINDFTLFNVLQVAINGANRPSTNDVLELLNEVINYNFNFCKKVSINMVWNSTSLGLPFRKYLAILAESPPNKIPAKYHLLRAWTRLGIIGNPAMCLVQY
jgi:hypothetical protein